MALANGSGGYQLGDGNLNEPLMGVQPTPVALTAAATLTAAIMANGIVTYNGAAVNLTTDTGANLDAAFNDMKINSCIDFYIVNIGSTNAATLVAGTGGTVVGAAAVAAGGACQIRVIKTAAATYSYVRVAG